MNTEDYFDKYKLIKGVNHIKMIASKATLKIQYKKRKNSKASSLFLTDGNNYLTSLYPINPLVQSIQLDSLENGYTGDVNGIKVCLYIKGNEAILLQYKAYKPKQRKFNGR